MSIVKLRMVVESTHDTDIVSYDDLLADYKQAMVDLQREVNPSGGVTALWMGAFDITVPGVCTAILP